MDLGVRQRLFWPCSSISAALVGVGSVVVSSGYDWRRNLQGGLFGRAQVRCEDVELQRLVESGVDSLMSSINGGHPALFTLRCHTKVNACMLTFLAGQTTCVNIKL